MHPGEEVRGINNIERRRTALKLSRKTVCEYVGICEKSYYLYAIAQDDKATPIPSDKLKLFAEILDCSTDYLLGLKKYTNITVVDNTGALLAGISQDKIIEHRNCKVILS